ncbi:MAG: hypothetical protein JKY65_00805 [Planctomycetes bacterium]|nr:hypothetical protein [Planctomycetota bacterium]
MIRSALLGAVSLLLLAPAATAQESVWLPLADGNTWTYEVTETTGVAGTGITRLSKATCVCRKSDEGWVLQWSGDDKLRVRVRAKGTRIEILASSQRAARILPGDLSTPSGAKSATLKMRVGGDTIELQQHRVSKPSSLRLPYGEVSATSVSSTVEVASVRIKSEVWFAKDLGVVKVVEQVVSAGAVGVRRELRLVSFSGATAGKAKRTEPLREKTVVTPKSTASGTKTGAGLVTVRELVKSWNPAGWKTTSTGIERAVKRLQDLGATLPIPAKAIQRLLSSLVLHPLQQVGGRAKLTERGWFDERRILSRGLLTRGSLKDVLVISTGDVRLGSNLKDSIVIVEGDLEISGFVKDVLLIVSGKIKVGGHLKNSIVLARGELVVSGFAKGVICEAKAARVKGYTKESTWIDTPLKTPRQVDDQFLEAKGGPVLDEVFGKAK